MDYKDIQQMPEKELHELLSEQRNALREYRFAAGERQLKQVHRIGLAKKTVARILTALRLKKAASRA